MTYIWTRYPLLFWDALPIVIMGRETNVSSREIDDLHILLNLKSNLKNYGNHLVGIIQGSIIWDNGGFESNI